MNADYVSRLLFRATWLKCDLENTEMSQICISRQTTETPSIFSADLKHDCAKHVRMILSHQIYQQKYIRESSHRLIPTPPAFAQLVAYAGEQLAPALGLYQHRSTKTVRKPQK